MPHSIRSFFTIFLLLLVSLPFTSKAVTYTWKTSAANTSWTDVANWTPDNSIPGYPGSSDHAIINACTTCPVLTANVNLTKLTIQHLNGTINIGTSKLTVTTLNIFYGNVISSGGTIDASFVQDIRYCQFNGVTSIKTGPGDAGKSYGSNTYNDKVTFTHAGTFINGYSFGNTFNGEVEIINNGGGNVNVGFFLTSIFKEKVTLTNNSGSIGFSAGAGSKAIFEGEVIVNNSASSGNVNFTDTDFQGAVTVNNGPNARQTGFNGNCTFNGAVTLSHMNARAYTPTSHNFNWGINFGTATSTAVSTFSPNASLQIAPATATSGFVGGGLHLFKVVFQNQLAATNLILSAGSFVQIGSSSSFAGPVSITAPHILVTGTTFSKGTTLEKTALTNIYMSPNNGGGNIFNGATTIKNTGGGLWYFGQYAADQFNNDLTVIHSGGNGTYLAHWSNTANQAHKFKGNLTLTLSAGATGVIQLGGAGGTSEQTTDTGDKTLTVNGSSGSIRLGGFTQRGASAPVFSFATNGSASLTLGGATLFEAPVSLSVPQLFLNGATFNQASSFTKTGSGSNNSTGGNVFKSKVTITNTATSGYFLTGIQTDDLINQ